MRIFLVGLPGSGKSFWSQQLAQTLSLPAYDLDELIEQHAQDSIPTIFQSKGEAYFRQLEHEVLQQLIESKYDFVLSVGGGTPCFFHNMALMNAKGMSIWLNPPVTIIAHRLWQDGVSKRPLLAEAQNEQEVLEKVEKLLENRAAYYSESTHQIKKKSPTLRDFLKLLSL